MWDRSKEMSRIAKKYNAIRWKDPSYRRKMIKILREAKPARDKSYRRKYPEFRPLLVKRGIELATLNQRHPSNIQISIFRSLCARGFKGLRLEYKVGKYSLDIALPKAKLDIEIDGEYWHSFSSKRDRRRDKTLEKLGWVVIRVPAKMSVIPKLEQELYMANVSGWKNFERDVAEALGGQRRLRTTESYGKKATDVRWPSDVKNKYPFLKNVMVECKKKKQINIYNEMALARIKYAKEEDSIVVLACKRPAPGTWNKRKRILIKFAMDKLKISEKKAKKLVRRDHFIHAIVTVDMNFFAELFEAWKEAKSGKSSGQSKSSE